MTENLIALFGASAGAESGFGLANATHSASPLSSEMFLLIGHSILTGIMLVLVTHFASRLLVVDRRNMPDPIESLLSAANLLFLCVGLTGVMILINNNLVRAFAIVAAIALIRFRARIDKKGVSSSLLFGVLAGMACGVGEVYLAWTMTFVYSILMSILVVFVYLARPKIRSPKQVEKPSFDTIDQVRDENQKAQFFSHRNMSKLSDKIKGKKKLQKTSTKAIDLDL